MKRSLPRSWSEGEPETPLAEIQREVLNVLERELVFEELLQEIGSLSLLSPVPPALTYYSVS